MKYYFFLAGLLILTNAHAELYRSIDSSGRVHYSDKPLAGAQDVAQVRADKAPTPDESLPYETQRARQNFPVTLYSFPDCGSVCQEGRGLLNKRGVPFTEKSLVTLEDIEAFNKASGDKSLPKLSVGKTWIRGFLAEQWNRELDVAGYPKTAPYRPRPSITSPSRPSQSEQPEQPAQSEQPAPTYQ